MTILQRERLGIFVGLLVLFGIYLASWLIQSQLLLHFDVSWLTFAAGKMLTGGNYINNFLETNPPLILYLYLPLAFLKKTLGISVIESIRVYVFLLSGLSLLLCARLLQQLFLKKEQFIYYAMIWMLAGIFLILPVNEFGQREHLTVIFTCPYLFLLSLRLERKPVPRGLFTGLVGLLGGIGFCIKPYFLFPWALLELYYAYRMRSWRAALKPEVLTLVSFIGFYLILLLVFHQDYIYQIIPLVSQFYYQRYQRSLVKLLTIEESTYIYFVLFLYCMIDHGKHAIELLKVLLISAIGFWMVFIGQRMGWYYHALPLIASALLLTLLLLLSFSRKPKWSPKEWISVSLFILIFLGFACIKMPYIRLCANFFTASYLFFFITILFSLLWIHSSFKPNKRLFYSMAFILFVNIIFYQYVSISSLHDQLFVLSSSMFILTYALVTPGWNSGHKFQNILLSIIAVFVFALPAYKMAYLFNSGNYYKQMYTRLTETMKKYAGRKVMYLSNASEMAFPNMDYSGQIYSSRFWSLSWLPAMQFPYAAERYPAYLKEHQKQLQFYMQALVSDLEKNQPDFIFVDVRTKGYFYTLPPYYLRLFTLDKEFRDLWKNYHYRETLDQRPLYKLDVYQRIDYRGDFRDIAGASSCDAFASGAPPLRCVTKLSTRAASFGASFL